MISLAHIASEGMKKENVSAMDVPLEARQRLDSEIEHPTFSGSVLGVLESKHAEWFTLQDIVSASRLLDVWKQPGETVSVELVAKDGQTEIAALR